MWDTQTVAFVRRKPRPKAFSIGMQGDNRVMAVQFYMMPAQSGMEAFVKLEQPDGALKIPLSAADSGYVWDVRRSSLNSAGRFPAQLLVQESAGNIVWQSEIFHVDVGESILNSEPTTDEPDGDGGSAQAGGYAQEAKASADRAEAAADKSEDAAGRSEAAAERAEESRRQAQEWIEQLGEIQWPNGTDAQNLELRSTDTHLQWRIGAEAEWTDLVALTDIAGPRGDAGATGGQGETGAPGADGKSAFDTAVSGGYAAGEDQFRRDLAAIGGLADALLAIIGE